MLPEPLPTEAHLIAPDTFLVPTLAKDPSGMGFFSANTMVIRGTEPVVVDTGASLVREHWLDAVTSVIADAFARTAALAAQPAPSTPDQSLLDQLLASLATSEVAA
jgi:hypothetical protein